MIVLILVTISTDVTRKSVHPQHCKMEGWHSWTAVEIKEEQDNEEGGESEMKLLSLSANYGTKRSLCRMS